jgi:Ca-activated chloride channel family protein
MFRFENPQILIGLWLIPALWILTRILNQRFKKRLTKSLGQRLTPFLTASISTSKRKWKLLLQSLTIFFFIIAAARLQFGTKVQEIKSQGVEMMILFDVSESMMSEDVRPSRIEFAKKEVERFLDLIPGSKIGLVAFAGNAALVSPITTDASALKLFVESLSTNSVSSQGTDFKKAFEVAEGAFKRGGTNSEDPLTKATKVMVLFSDGEDQEQGAMDEAERLGKTGIKIFSVAIGTEKGGPIPERDPTGYLRGYKKDQSGQTVITTQNGEALKGLAKKGGGSFYYSTFAGEYLKSMASDINKLEKAEFESSLAVQYEERYQIFLILGLITALIDIWLGDRRSQFRLWKGRFEVPQ